MTPQNPALHDGRHDFDFLHGKWHSRQRRLRKRLVGCDEWDEFDADLHCSLFSAGVSAIEPPVIGHFADGTGDFISPDTHEGIPVLGRFRWSAITATSARWAQALSADDGGTWETNWTAEFTRAG